MCDKQETFLLTDGLVRAVLSRHKQPTTKEVQDLTFSITSDVLTTEQYVERRWPGVKVPDGIDVRELIIGRDAWNKGRVPDAIVAIDVNLAEEDLLNPKNHALGPMRWLGIFHLVNGILKALHGDLDGQSFADGWETVASLVGLLKPAFRVLTPVQIAVMAVAHDVRGEEAPWDFWFDEVNEYLRHWKLPDVSRDTLRSQVALLRKTGFTVHDEGDTLRIPTSMVVVSVKHLKAVTNTMLKK